MTQDMLYKIHVNKTAFYSIEAPMRFGAIAAGTDISISAFAEPLGLAYQITDDIIGMFGEQEETGKPVVSDLAEGKATILSLHTLMHASGEDKARFQQLLGKVDANDTDLAEAREIMQRSGSLEFARTQAQQHIDRALIELETVRLTDEARQAIAELVAKFTNRSK